jgi:acyl-CoA synthetase (AMP-forming)/AMP-acid ligase II
MTTARPNLLTLLNDAVAATPSAPFLTDLRTGESWTYAELAAGACHMAALLAQHGVAPGDRVAFLTKNDPVFFPLLFACAMTGSILVPINRDNLRIEINTVLDDAKPIVVLYDERRSVMDDAAIAVAWRKNEPPAPPPAPENAGEDVLIIYTSGTTGNAKGVTLTHRNLTTMARTFVDFYHLREGQRFLSMLPFYHINAPMITGLVCVAARAHVHLTEPYGFSNARAIFDMVEANRINVLSLTPSIMASLVQLNPQGTSRNIASLELAFCGTAPLGEKLWCDFETLFKIPVYQGYGLTETTTWATMTPPDARKRYDTVGIPVGCEIKVDGDVTGEVMIKSDIVMSGYFNKKKLTRKSLRDGWYYTGDVGHIDEDGQLAIVGRTKNIIKRRGILIHPEAIDTCLRQNGLVLDSCTVGVPDGQVDERVISAVVLASGTVAEVRAYLTGRLSPYMRPDEIVAVHAIPRNPVGKTLAGKVRDLVSGEAAERVVQTFNRSKISRAPSERIAEIRTMVHNAALDGKPIVFSGFWGVGGRREAADPDRRALARLAELRSEIDTALGQPQTEIKLVLADLHGRCNRIPDEHIDRYFEEIAALAAEHGLETRRLSELWQEAGLCEADVARMAADPAIIAAWQEFPMRDDFLRQAENRCGSPDQAEEFAFRYYCTCIAERGMLSAALAGTIFFTYNDPKFRIIQPDLPTVHLHSIKPGTTAKPWFM